MDVDKNLDELKKQLKNAEVVYYKILGAVEAFESIQKEESKNSSDKSKAK